MEPSEVRGKKDIPNPVMSLQQTEQICPKHMTTTQHGIGQKRSSHNLEATQSQQQPLLGKAKVPLGAES